MTTDLERAARALELTDAELRELCGDLDADVLRVMRALLAVLAQRVRGL